MNDHRVVEAITTALAQPGGDTTKHRATQIIDALDRNGYAITRKEPQ